MRISALSEATGVPVPTLKFYLREGLLHPGEATSRTRAEYDAMAQTAHELGIRFGGHVPAEVGIEHALAAGQPQPAQQAQRAAHAHGQPLDDRALGPGGVLFDPAAGGDVRQLGVEIPDGWMGVDIGPGSAAAFGDLVHEAGTVLWNGPMGVFEDPRFGGGTGAVAHALAEARAFTVVGGGDSAAAARLFKVDRDMDHVSTGGGASLGLIEKGDLPGLAALRGAPRVG